MLLITSGNVFLGSANIHSIAGDVIIKSKTIPQASASVLGKIYIYAGATNDIYTHGYIYECVADNTKYEAIFYIEPVKIAYAEYDKAALFLQQATPNFRQISSGSMTYIKSANIWQFVFRDSSGNIILDNYRLYTEDIENAGFLLLYPIETFSDGEVLTFDIVWREQADSYSWKRLDIQP